MIEGYEVGTAFIGMLDTCKDVKKAKKESHDVLGKHVTKLSTYSKLQYIPIVGILSEVTG